MKKLKTLRYYGGKNPYNNTGKFVANLIPWNKHTTYVEPFAGMLGVLLQRKPVANEIINDLNSDVVNWWNQVRENTEKLAHKIAFTPWSRETFNNAQKMLLNPKLDNLNRAWAFHVIIQQSLFHGPCNNNSWSIGYNYLTNASSGKWTGKELLPLANRLFRVQVENRNALGLLERMIEEDRAVIYCDPPYRSANTNPYGVLDIDWDRMTELVKSQKGKVAISGYGDEWDQLGWVRNEYKTIFRGTTKNKKASERIEVLWTNYQPVPNTDNLFQDFFEVK